MSDEQEIGKVVGYFTKIGVAAIELTRALSKGDKIHIKGNTTDFKQTIDSIQIENSVIDEAEAGQSVGIKVKDRVRPNDKVYKI